MPVFSRSRIRPHEVQPKFDAVARRALSLLAADLQTHNLPVAPDLLNQLLQATRHIDRARFMAVADRLLAQGMSAQQMVHQYIPAVARLLGEDWLADRTNFAGVTIGCARLQGLVHHLAYDWTPMDAHAPRCLMLTPEGEQHTLGATILTARLRENGVYVQVAFGTASQAVPKLVAGHDYNAVMISSADRHNLASIARMTSLVRQANAAVPVLVGGSILQNTTDVAAAVGADHVTNSWEEALRVCKLNTQQDGLALRCHTPHS